MHKITKALAAAGAAATLTVALTTATAGATVRAAGPNQSTVTITTHSNAHYDTTNVSGSATLPSPNGPVWAIDSLNERWVVVPCADAAACDSADNADYYVTMTTPNSHFAEFANPGPNDPAAGITSTCTGKGGGPRNTTGKVNGTISWSVVSNASPDLSSVPNPEPPATGLGAVLAQIFDNATDFATVGANPYDFKYANVCGSVYEQTG